MKSNRRVLVIICIIICGLVVHSSEKERLLKRKRKLEQEIELATKILEDTKTKKSNSVQELRVLKARIRKRTKLIKEYKNSITEINTEIENKKIRLESYKKDLHKIRKEYAGLIYHTFKNKNASLDLMYLLASSNINQIYARFVYLQQYKKYRIKNIRMIEQLQKLIEVEIISLTSIKEEKTRLLNGLIVENAVLIRDKGEVNSVVKSLKKEEVNIQKQLAEKKKLAKKLDKEIEDIIKKETKKNTYTNLTPKEKLISDDFKTNKGRLPWPTAQGIITDQFGEHPHPAIKDLMIRNNGIDIATIRQAQARVVFSGVVSKVFSIKGANSTVIVRHGNFYTVYHNMRDVNVKAGDNVVVKQKLGTIFTDIKTNQTILHFEVWEEIEKKDPEQWLAN